MALSSWLARGRWLAILLAIGLIAPVQSGGAGPVADFENALRAAYGDYRMALVQTNNKNAEASVKAIEAFTAKWAALASTYSTAAPPQYADDPRFPAVMAEVADVAGRARAAASAGRISEAHDILEAIRDAIGDLRLRNGMMGFSDRMNAVHSLMEHMLVKKYDGFSPAGLDELREDAAVLAYLCNELRKHPAPEISAADYAPTLQALLDAVAELQRAARSGDGAASRLALGKIKPSYGRLFVKYG